ncbi:hypothetical protein HDU81_007371 [Chytriomyces hyalinus]|nr:hypothetical protein HDU81_007371 [Chytriomyces hyalinus]
MPSRDTLESMPPEILDQIASFLSADHDILHLSHAVRYYKYISHAMFYYAHALKNPPRPADLWPRIKVQHGLYSTRPPTQQLLGAYSRILSNHGGTASVDKPVGLNILNILPERLEVFINDANSLKVTDEFFGALYKAKKTITKLSFGKNVFRNGKLGPAILTVISNGLSRLPIRYLRFQSTIPTQILGTLHMVPMLGSLHLPSLEDCAGIAFSECKSLTTLSISKVFDEGMTLRNSWSNSWNL